MKKQMKQAGGLISFSIKGTKETAQRFMNQLKLIKIAVSLGEIETLIQHIATMTHSVVPEEERKKWASPILWFVCRLDLKHLWIYLKIWNKHLKKYK